MSYHNMNHYAEGPGDDLVMAELSVHREPPVYQEPFYQNYNPPAQNHYQELTYQPHAREQQQQQQHPAHLHHPQHQHTIQQLEPSVRHPPQPSAPSQGTEEVIDQSYSPPLPQQFIKIGLRCSKFFAHLICKGVRVLTRGGK
ncbi:hypothetical protein EYF80_048038 [Liparis tanakae]|uniref:Uncharacterized protein n=1 Tax=Liparis tanakae TaxID=230148 RepID=A0A4Z2FM05_9TELE|nr:hypothetical protein EYF80_048038 [Liparis tanakae]